MMPTRRTALALLLSAGSPALAQQPRPQQRPPQGPSLSAPRTLMAGSMATAFISRAPANARLAISRPTDPAEAAIVASPLGQATVMSLPAPGEVGTYEWRLLGESDGKPVILLRQPLLTTAPNANLAAPARVARGNPLPVRGIGPNGDRDRVVLVKPDAPPEAQGPNFFPAENVESTLEAPGEPGIYELRYVMDAPLTGPRVLARREVVVE
jgi:Ca-activated chloride channel family protein